MQANLLTAINETDKQTSLNFAWNLFGTDATIIGLFLGIIFAYKIDWFNTPLRIITYIVVTLMLIIIVSFIRWNRILIKSSMDVSRLSKNLIEETSELQSRHSALARDHEKNTDRYKNLKEHYSVLVTAVGLLQQGIRDIREQNSRESDRR